MRPYDSRPITLDPGLTALALRALRNRGTRYPFVEPHVRRPRAKRDAASTGNASRVQPRYVLIVNRQHPQLFNALRRALGPTPGLLGVMVDRRVVTRRRSTVAKPKAERRRDERRRTPPVAWQVFGLLLAPQRGTRTTGAGRATPHAP